MLGSNVSAESYRRVHTVLEDLCMISTSVPDLKPCTYCTRVFMHGSQVIAEANTRVHTVLWDLCHCLRMCDTKGSTCLLWDIATEKSGLCCYAVRITQNTYVKKYKR